MKKAESWGIASVTSQLNQGKKLTNKLKRELHHHSNSSECEFLIEKIISCYDNALAMLNHMDSLQNGDSTTLLHFSPTSEVCHQDFKEHIPKKRKSLERWVEEVNVCCETRSEDQHEDGYNWRKYGQKDILGASHPRSYYRCTYRNTRGCLATKQVQRGEDEPPTLKMVYKGKHSCGLKEKKLENVITTAETNEERSQEMKQYEEIIASPPLISSINNLKIDHHTFLDLDQSSSFPLGDFDFLFDFDAPFF